MTIDDGLNRAKARVERAIEAAGLQFIIFNEVHAGLCKDANLLRRDFRRHPDARFDDRSDDGPVVDIAERARSGNAELRALVAIEKCWREFHVEQFQSGKWTKLRKIAGNRRHYVRQREPRVRERPGQFHFRGAAF